jgi:hypothetical protein
MGAALATTLSTIIMTVISYIYSQKHAPIKLELGHVLGMYFLLLLSSFVIIGVEFSFIDIDYYWILGVKLIFLSLYMYLGNKADVVRWTHIKKAIYIIKTKTRTVV